MKAIAILLIISLFSIVGGAEEARKSQLGHTLCERILQAIEMDHQRQQLAANFRLQRHQSLLGRVWNLLRNVVQSEPGPSQGPQLPGVFTPLAETTTQLRGATEKLQARNHDLSSIENAKGVGQKEFDIIQSVNIPNVVYFREQIFHGLDLRTGRSWQLPVLTEKERELRPGLARSTIKFNNRIPTHWTRVYLPPGFRFLPHAQQENLQLEVTASGDALVRSPVRGWLNIHLARDDQQDISAKEIAAYTTINGKVEISQWPEAFRKGIDLLLSYRQSHPDMKGIEIANLVQQLIKSYFQYTFEAGRDQNAIQIVESGKCQCTWSATLAVGILRQYFGVSSRVVAGRIGYISDKDPQSSWVLETKIGHAWIEVFDFGERRWHLLDPTPSSPDGQRPGAEGRLPSGFREAGSNQGSDYSNSSLWTQINEWDRQMALDRETEAKVRRLDEVTRAFGDIERSYSNWKADEDVKMDSNKTAPISFEARAREIYLEAAWVTVLRAFANFDDFRNSLDKFYEQLAGLRENTWYKGDHIIRYYEEKANALRKALLLWNVNYRDFASLGEDIGSEKFWRERRFSRKSLISFFFKVLSEIKENVPLTQAENALYRIVVNLLNNAPHVPALLSRQQADEAVLATFQTPLAIEQAKKLLTTSENPFLEAPAEMKPLSAEWHELLAELQFNPLLTFLDTGAPPPIMSSKPLRERTVMSDDEPEIETASNLNNRRHLLRGGLPPNFDVFRIQNGKIEQSVFYESANSERQSVEFPEQITIIDFDIADVDKAAPTFNRLAQVFVRAALDYAQKQVVQGAGRHQFWLAPFSSAAENHILKAMNYGEALNFYSSDLTGAIDVSRGSHPASRSYIHDAIAGALALNPNIKRLNSISVRPIKAREPRSFWFSPNLTVDSSSVTLFSDSTHWDPEGVWLSSRYSIDVLETQALAIRLRRLLPSLLPSLEIQFSNSDILNLKTALHNMRDTAASQQGDPDWRSLLQIASYRLEKWDDPRIQSEVVARTRPDGKEPFGAIDSLRHVLVMDNSSMRTVGKITAKKFARDIFGVPLPQMGWRLTTGDLKILTSLAHADYKKVTQMPGLSRNEERN